MHINGVAVTKLEADLGEVVFGVSSGPEQVEKIKWGVQSEYGLAQL